MCSIRFNGDDLEGPFEKGINFNKNSFWIKIVKTEEATKDLDVFLDYWNIDPSKVYIYLSSDSKLKMTYDPKKPEFLIEFKNQ